MYDITRADQTNDAIQPLRAHQINDAIYFAFLTKTKATFTWRPDQD